MLSQTLMPQIAMKLLAIKKKFAQNCNHSATAASYRRKKGQNAPIDKL